MDYIGKQLKGLEMCWRLIVSLRGINYLVVEPKAKQRWRDAEGVMTEWVYGYTTYELERCWR